LHKFGYEKGDSVAYTMSTKEIEEFAQKLTKWSESLTDNERTLLSHVLDEHGRSKRAELSNRNLKALLEDKLPLEVFRFVDVAPKLDARLVGHMCW
jgi:hypothetical protein